MEFKQVFLFNGEPYLAFKGEDEEYQYPEDEWTEIPPPEGLYQPIYFNGNEWQDATKEEWEKSLPKEKSYEPSEIEKQLAFTQLQLTKMANQLIKSRNEQAQLTLELTKKEQRIHQLEQMAAQTMLTVSQLKGGQ